MTDTRTLDEVKVDGNERDRSSDWPMLYAEWLKCRAKSAAADCDDSPLTDEEGEKLLDDEASVVQAMATCRAALVHQVGQKLSVLQSYMGERWTDRREALLLASIKADVAELSP